MSPHHPHRHSLFDRFGAPGSLLSLWFDGSLEAALVSFVTLLGLLSLGWSYRRHRALRALGLLVPGLAALWAGLLYAPLHESVVPHAVVMTFGGTLVGLAHLLNLRLNPGHRSEARRVGKACRSRWSPYH